MLIKCKRCGKEIEQKGRREYCIPCRKIIDREIQEAYREKLKEERRTRNTNQIESPNL